MSQKITPKTSAAKDPTGAAYVATAFDCLATPTTTGVYRNGTVVFRDANGKALPNGTIPLVSPETLLSESQAICAAIGAATSLAGETPQATMTRASAQVIVISRGVVLAS